MNHESVPHFLGLLVIILSSARISGILCRWLGQPAVLGELLVGVMIGPSLLQLVDPGHETLHMLAQLGVVLLMFQIGLETDLRKLLTVWRPAAVVAVAGVLFPLVLGYLLCRAFDFSHSAAIATGAVLAVTGIGVSARILSDLGRLDDVESRIVLGAAVIDDMLGLVVLTVVGTAFSGDATTSGAVAAKTGIALAFLLGTLWLGARVVPPVIHRLSQLDLPGNATTLAVIVALAFAWIAAAAGATPMVGAFASGLLLRRSPQASEIERGIVTLGRFLVPIFFVMVGTMVNLRLLNPATSGNSGFLPLVVLLFATAVLGKLLAGYMPFWYPCRKAVIGWAMVPRGAIGLVFAQFALVKNILDERLFSAIALMIILTTMIAPPMVRWLLPPKDDHKPPRERGSGTLVSDP